MAMTPRRYCSKRFYVLYIVELLVCNRLYARFFRSLRNSNFRQNNVEIRYTQLVYGSSYH